MYIYLDIVEEFVCEMCGACCRNDWMVTLNEDSYYRNARLFMKTGRSEEFSQIFIPLIDKSGLGEYAYIEKKISGGCWFLAENNRCLLQGEAGHNHLDQNGKPYYPAYYYTVRGKSYLDHSQSRCSTCLSRTTTCLVSLTVLF